MEELRHFNGLIVNVLNMKDENLYFPVRMTSISDDKVKQVSLAFYWLIKTMSMGCQFRFYLEPPFNGWQQERNNCIKHKISIMINLWQMVKKKGVKHGVTNNLNLQ